MRLEMYRNRSPWSKPEITDKAVQFSHPIQGNNGQISGQFPHLPRDFSKLGTDAQLLTTYIQNDRKEAL